MKAQWAQRRLGLAKAIQSFCIMNFESKLSVHATETLHKQNLVLFDLNNAFCSKDKAMKWTLPNWVTFCIASVEYKKSV